MSVPQRQKSERLHGTASPSVHLSQTAASIRSKGKYSNVEDGIRNKLSYEWKTIYRRLNAGDADNSGRVPMSKFENTLRQTKTFLSREDLTMIRTQYKAKESGGAAIDYDQLSKNLLGSSEKHNNKFDIMRRTH